jgi:hypothetical protein
MAANAPFESDRQMQRSQLPHRNEDIAEAGTPFMAGALIRHNLPSSGE